MATETESSGSKIFSMLGDTLESAAEALEEASVNSTESAKKAAKTTKRAIGTGLHKAAYGISYGVVYAAVFLVELLPEEHVIRRGFVEGAEAALDARQKAKASKEVIIPENTPAKRTNAKTKSRARTSPRAKKAVEKRAAEFEAAAAEQ
ncbi:MAG: hypothetical protein JOZ61_05225 [Verrucomicrobia bacterium]|nr:hypothetical protein [Verrucomicrobiota bacterium]